MIRQVKQIVTKIIDTILPPRCPVNGEVVDAHGMVSAEGWAALDFISEPFCASCGVPFDVNLEHKTLCLECLNGPNAFDHARSALIYDDVSRAMILSFKHGDKMHIAPSFIPWLLRCGDDILYEADCIIPVPLHPMRLVSRRYNQAVVISQILSKEIGVKHLPMALKRVRHTVSQGHMSASDRTKNVRNAFDVRDSYKEEVRGRKIILIDDVFTSGATVNECARVLKKHGAAQVDVLTVARVVKKG